MNFLSFLKWIIVGIFMVLSITLFAAPKNEYESEAQQVIAELYHTLHKTPKLDMLKRIDAISAKFLNKPYLLGALGEGSQGDYDQNPLYRTDAFDCLTYVETVLAIAFSPDLETFNQCLRKLRYQNGKISFITRNHFTSVDWNLNNQKQGFIKDITTKFKNKKNQPVAKIAYALINKPGWYQHFTVDDLRLKGDATELNKRLDALKHEGNKLSVVKSFVPYIPLTTLFDRTGRANDFLFKQIPNGAIIEIVRPNWDLRKEIGTCLNISHLGFAFWKNGTLVFRQASSNYGKTVEVSLIDYLHNALASPTIKGINVQIILPQHTLGRNCRALQQPNDAGLSISLKSNNTYPLQ
ncbi:N-acetylmuramoyl-L-alanine amidase-like domain-containing protein [Legionella septentrionalis]|uniref:N-acetylmuramoyl-L-alanine amidase-like domain-containing protein n=1 Tax=Legionella septentrionalis TaxID=2498109 RepID=UPI000F8F3061|nr:N-acetylmuramoyl-L-alanine amidase-like domain-containing protein [Legionella septentrionalis]RUQ99308.1 DUF1460 domain-containing protein [Legionella septentrionalis]